MIETRPLFSDMPADKEMREAIEWAVRMGLFKGHSDGTFRPDDPITRGQAAILEQRRARNLLALIRYATTGLRDRCMSAVFQLTDYRQFPLSPAGSVGSGVIIHPAGFAVTNYHVVADYLARREANPNGGGELIATWAHGPMLGRFVSLGVIDTDADNDLALVRLISRPDQPTEYPWVRLASTEEVPGEPVVIMGAPLGHASWESHGYVAREEVSIGRQSVIAIAGAVNPGNSGGALIRASDGTLLGIPSMKPSDPAVDGMAYGIHFRDVQRLMTKWGVVPPAG